MPSQTELMRLAEMRAEKKRMTLGTLIPDSVYSKLSNMMDATSECKPFAPYSDNANQDFMDVCLEGAAEITRVLLAIKEVHEGDKPV